MVKLAQAQSQLTKPQPVSAEAWPDRGLVSVILATFDERENIDNTINDIFENVPAPVEIIVVDDDSPDETWRLVMDLGDPRVKVIRRVNMRGLASAFMRGIIESQGDIVCWMDADTCMPAATLGRMIETLRSDDISIGSRYVEGGRDERTALRTTASRLINWLARTVLGHGIRDYDSGFVAVRRCVFDKVLPLPTGYGEYFIEFIYAACKNGLRVNEVGYVFRDRSVGSSKSFASVWRFLLLGTRYVYRIFQARLRRLD